MVLHARDDGRAIGLLFCAVTVAGFAAPAAAHPGQHLNLEIKITDEAVTYDIILSTDLGHRIILNDFTDFVAVPAEQRFRFVDAELEGKTRVAYDAFFKERNRVMIDGVEVKPVLTDLEFVPNFVLAGEFDPYSFPPDAHVVLTYPAAGRPNTVAMTWDLYPQDPTRAAFGLESTLEVFAELDAYEENKIVCFLAEEPEVIWHAADKPPPQTVRPVIADAVPATFTCPVTSIIILVVWASAVIIVRTSRRWHRLRKQVAVCTVVIVSLAWLARDVGSLEVRRPGQEEVRLPSAPEAVELFASLHRNIYRAFEYKKESDIYDVLAQSVDGSLLDQVYNEVFRSLILRDQGGAVARVQAVDILDAKLESAGVVSESAIPAFQIRTRWQVRGAVAHWGHVHSRTNEYKAVYTVAQRGPAWKIVSVQDVEQQRIVKPGDDPPVAPRTPTEVLY